MDELKHFGVKGMHWGQRKSPEQLDKKWHKPESIRKHYMDAHNKSIPEMNAFLDKLNAKFGNKHLNTGDHPSYWNATTKMYVKAYDTNYQKALNKHLHTIVSPSGKYHLTAKVKDGEAEIVTKEKKK